MKTLLPQARATLAENAAVEPRLLRTKQAARYLNVSTWKVRRWIADDILLVVQEDPHAPFLIDRNDLDALIETLKHRHCDSP